MARRELPKHQRDLIVERYQLGEGYQRISKALDIPWNTVKIVIIKCRKYGTTETLPRTGRPSKIDEKTHGKLVREASKRPTATLKELQEFLELQRAKQDLLQVCISERAAQAERLRFQEQALTSLQDILRGDALRHLEESTRLQDFYYRVANQNMQGKSEHNNMELDFDHSKHPESPAFEDEPSLSVKVRQNPKYQLFLSGDMIGNGSRDTDEPARVENGFGKEPRNSAISRLSPNHRGSLESLASRDWDNMSDRTGGFESPPRVFNSPYTMSVDYNSVLNRMSDYKMQEGLSRAASELNIYNCYNNRSTSPVQSLTPTGSAPRTRFSTLDSIRRRDPQVMPSHLSMRPNVSTFTMPNKRDYIEELTKQMDTCQKRNQFLEAQSVEMDNERNQIRFEMRGLLVKNEDLLRTNTTLQVEMKRMNERIMELERDNTALVERFRLMETELKEAREVMVEANTQEYAFNFLQQSLKNKIKDSEEALEKQSLQNQGLSEKLWLAERQLETLSVDKEVLDKKNSELSSTVNRLESELSEALQTSTRASAELSLQQKLRDDAQLRVEELEESLLEKSQELQRAQETVNRLQGEVSGKLIDKERTLEEEIQLREKVQLQWKQAERTVDDLQMELHTAAQAKEDMAKQLKQAQEKLIDMESDLEEMHDSEQRWSSKNKRALEQIDQLQLKLIQEKDLNDHLDCEKVILERQLRELRLEVEELHNSRVQEDVVTKAESRAKELENALRVEERNKVVLTNTISKLERKIKELTDQLEEDHKMATEQKDQMNQRMRSLKRQLNEVEEEASRRDAQYRHTQRELAEEREHSSQLKRQLMDQSLQFKRTESTRTMRQTLEDLRLDLSVDEDSYTAVSSTASKA
uniref:Myosin tail domain-containing protein n=2 Tax=Esox lucius TaxID=8010 RepID=A0A3P9A581_ESOLU